MNFDKLKQFMDGLGEEFGVPGAEISVMQEHRKLFHHTVGVRDLETREPLRGGELYYFCSATKPLTCTAVLQLFEKGLLGLNDPIERYLPEFKNPVVRLEDGSLVPSRTSVTVTHLLSMTSGLNYDLSAPEIARVIEETAGRAPTREIVRAIAARPLAFHPGERWMYGLSHDVLAALIEVISGMRYSEYVRRSIFDPLGMRDSCFHSNAELRSRMPTQYRLSNGKTVRMLKTNPLELGTEFESGGGSLISSVGEYMLFTDALANGGVGASGNRILCEKTIDLMRENRVGDRMAIDSPAPRFRGYGYGCGVRTLISCAEAGLPSSLGEFGWDGARGVYLLIDPSRRLSMTYAESRGAYKDQIQPRLRELLYTCMDKEV